MSNGTKESDGCVVVVSSADDSREDLPCAKGASPPCLAGASERKSKYPRVDAPDVEEIPNTLEWIHASAHIRGLERSPTEL